MQKLMQENENLLPNLCNYLMSYKPHTEKKTDDAVLYQWTKLDKPVYKQNERRRTEHQKKVSIYVTTHKTCLQY